MSVRLIAGKYGSLVIKSPKGFVTHPMGDRIRGALFNSIVAEIEGAEVLDAFAGSGALGFEALSRGAKSVVFVDNNQSAVRTIIDNAKGLNLDRGQARVIRSGVASWAASTDQKFDIIFADPPYDNMQPASVERLFKLLKTKGLMVLSYPGRGEAPTANGVVVVDNRSYGNAALAFYHKTDA